jgi:phosphoglucosamine mutase
MGKYFGTDGVRGVANSELTPELAFRLGRCGGYVLAGRTVAPTVVIGRDTRISGPMLEASLVAGLLSIGANVVRLGVITTPGVAYLTRILGADAGVMISASHNPFEDNGIKFFGKDGFKLSDDTELEIERLMDAADELPRPVGEQLGVLRDDELAKWKYVEYLKTTIGHRFDGLKIVLDCAHGAAYELAPQLFRELGAEVVAIGASPDGLNINKGIGSTHPEALQKEVRRHRADLGLSFDGDADRLMAVDGEGHLIDGDQIICICSYAMHKQGRLRHDSVVTTVMSNVGLYKVMKEMGLHTLQTAVGDRYVMEEMRKGGYNLGGEQSGHVIFLDYNTTGDGMLTALQLVDIVRGEGKSLRELGAMMEKFPQMLVNVKVRDKHQWKGNEAIAEAVRVVEAELGEFGRVLLRPSGTEPLIRVMAEGPAADVLERYVQQIAEVVKAELG